MNKITKEKLLEKNDLLLEYLSQHNTKEYNLLKLLEELSELQEVLVKYHTKDILHKPDKTLIMREFMDVLLRGGVIMFNIFEELSTEEIAELGEFCIDEKTQKIINYIKDGKYQGGC